MTAMNEITKQIQGNIILVNKEELKASDKRQSDIFQNEQNKNIKIKSNVADINFVHEENLQLYNVHFTIV